MCTQSCGRVRCTNRPLVHDSTHASHVIYLDTSSVNHRRSFPLSTAHHPCPATAHQPRGVPHSIRSSIAPPPAAARATRAAASASERRRPRTAPAPRRTHCSRVCRHPPRRCDLHRLLRCNNDRTAVTPSPAHCSMQRSTCSHNDRPLADRPTYTYVLSSSQHPIAESTRLTELPSLTSATSHASPGSPVADLSSLDSIIHSHSLNPTVSRIDAHPKFALHSVLFSLSYHLLTSSVAFAAISASNFLLSLLSRTVQYGPVFLQHCSELLHKPLASYNRQLHTRSRHAVTLSAQYRIARYDAN